jgi:phosphopantothenoylcysteine decarboxylase/phosphopantothenate--cysteine ligase
MQDLKVERISELLKGKSIALCITGGIAAIETPKIARHLRRYGAEVKAYTTPSALKFIGKASLEWATEKPVVNELSGLAEHICLEDIVIVAPATLNTINKILLGIADNVVTSLVASALGSQKPVYLAPTMHDSLYKNPFFQENLKKAERYKIKIIQPRFSEGKAKIAKTRDIVNQIADSDTLQINNPDAFPE